MTSREVIRMTTSWDRLAATVERLDGASGPALLSALVQLRDLRDTLTEWEPALIGAARSRGVTWAEIAPALGLSSRQAAERRYLRLNPRPQDAPSTTREERVDAARDQRSADRAVAGWARDNAATLRQLAGQITALEGLHPSAGGSLDRIQAALGGDDAAELVGALSDIGPPLSSSHPALADRVSAINQTTDRIRAADRDRRNSKGRRPTDA
jgi:hypothetical protein